MWNSLSNINLYEHLLAKKHTEGVQLTENDVNLGKMCRTCLREAPDTNNLLKDFEIGAINFNMDGKVLKLIDMLSESTNLEISETDYLPHQICNNCIQNISGAYFFRLQCHKAENILYRLHHALAVSSAAVSETESTMHNDEESISPVTEDEQITSDNGEDYDKEMNIEFDGVEYKIDSEIVRIDQEVEETLEQYTNNEKDLVEDSSTIRNIKIEIVEIQNSNAQTDQSITKVVSNSENISERPNEDDYHVESVVLPANNSNKCMECDITFEKKKDFNEHQKLCHPFSKSHKCEVCDARFTKGQSLKRHMKIHQADQKNKFCMFCEKGFTRADDLRRHIRVHTGECPYACKICPKRYKQTSELKEHMLTHSKEKNYVCSICGKALHTRNGHYVHMKTHLGVKKHSCEFCGKRYVTSGELHSHIRHIHEKTKPFACNIESCDRTFSTKLSLDIHIRAHTGERPYECTYCNKKLSTTSSLSEHMRIHTGTSRWTCIICRKMFNTSQTLKKHMRTHEYSDKSTDKPDAGSPSNGSYECLLCEKDFSNLDELERHADNHSNNDDQYQKAASIHFVEKDESGENYVVEMENADEEVHYVDISC